MAPFVVMPEEPPGPLRYKRDPDDRSVIYYSRTMIPQPVQVLVTPYHLGDKEM